MRLTNTNLRASQVAAAEGGVTDAMRAALPLTRAQVELACVVCVAFVGSGR
jgi:hypothetical protein